MKLKPAGDFLYPAADGQDSEDSKIIAPADKPFYIGGRIL
jgi:hypothetical protein